MSWIVFLVMGEFALDAWESWESQEDLDNLAKTGVIVAQVCSAWLGLS